MMSIQKKIFVLREQHGGRDVPTQSVHKKKPLKFKLVATCCIN